jgi:hypothetical protein
LAILGGSFRLLAKAFVPLALLFILAGCGSSTRHERVPTRVVHGTGFSFTAPRTWRVSRSTKAVVASRGKSLVSATRFTLLKRYDPSTFARVTVELDRDAAKLAQDAGGSLTQKETTMVDGRKIRAYRYTAHGYATRIGFVLHERQEVQLLCRARAGAGDPDGACALLFGTFSGS